MPNAQQEQQTTLEKPPGSQTIQPADIGAFFASMKAAFPMWNIEPSEVNIEIWHFELLVYTVADLRRAYKNIINTGGKSPPTLPEVKAACRGRPSDAMNRIQDHQALPSPEQITNEQAAANTARLKRIMAGVELNPSQHSRIGHLSVPMQQRFREIAASFPTHEGHIIDPSYIPDPEAREAYVAKIDAWRQENPNV